MNEKGHIFIITAPSGTGKSTLIKKIRENFLNLEESVSYTTRLRRKGEEEGKDYFFISLDEFKSKREEGEFIEWAEVHSNYYATSKSFVRNKVQEGSFLLFDLDIQGTRALKKEFQDNVTTIFIEPPSLDILEERLKKRGTESDEQIKERLENAAKELRNKDEFDFVIKNDDFTEAFENLYFIFSKRVDGINHD